MSSTGWPGVVAGFGAWVGPSSRGLVMGFWQSNAFVGNIIGRQLAGDFLEYGWGNSFILLSLILGLLIEDIMLYADVSFRYYWNYHIFVTCSSSQ